jgi:hypothetical protein
MSTTEIRVRPVVRHIVTRYEADERGASSSPLGEFTNEEYAEQVAEALRGSIPKPMQYVAVERTFNELTNAVYFDTEADATAYAEYALSKGREFRVFGREITDPVARARHEAGMASYGFPGGIEQVELPEALPRET